MLAATAGEVCRRGTFFRVSSYYNVIYWGMKLIISMPQNKPTIKSPISLIYKLISLLLFTCYFTLLPNFLHYLWPYLTPIPDPYFYIVITVGVNIVVFGAYDGVMWGVYRARNQFLETFRVEGKDGRDGEWPWDRDRDGWGKMVTRTLGLVLFNMFVMTPLLPFFEYTRGKVQYQKSLEAWPTTSTIFAQFLFCLFMQDLTFYWSHRAFHKIPLLYRLHKLHHQYTTPISLSATYAHPLQYLFGNLIPTGIGYNLLAKFFQVHFVTILVWVAFRLVETCEVHCGYEWGWRQLVWVPGKAGPRYHGFHHSRNVGNFGSMFAFWDWVMGTDQGYWEGLGRRNEGNQQEIKGQ